MSPTPGQYFRAGVGVVVTDGRGRVLVIERTDVPGALQLPQGGLEAGEEPHEASLRELKEETGLLPDDVELVHVGPGWLAYELPPQHRSPKTGRGQVQQWFLYRLKPGRAPRESFSSQEARRIDWLPLSQIIEGAVDFRKPVYRQMAEAFGPLLTGESSHPKTRA